MASQETSEMPPFHLAQAVNAGLLLCFVTLEEKNTEALRSPALGRGGGGFLSLGILAIQEELS